MKSLARLR